MAALPIDTPPQLACPLAKDCDWTWDYPQNYADPPWNGIDFTPVINARREALQQSVNNHFASHGSDLRFEYT